VYPSFNRSVFVSVCLFVRLFVRPFESLAVCLSVCLFVRLFVRPFESLAGWLTDSYTDMHSMRKVPLEPQAARSSAESAGALLEQTRSLVRKDLDLHEKGQVR